MGFGGSRYDRGWESHGGLVKYEGITWCGMYEMWRKQGAYMMTIMLVLGAVWGSARCMMTMLGRKWVVEDLVALGMLRLREQLDAKGITLVGASIVLKHGLSLVVWCMMTWWKKKQWSFGKEWVKVMVSWMLYVNEFKHNKNKISTELCHFIIILRFFFKQK